MVNPQTATAVESLESLNQLNVVGARPLITITTVFPFRFFPCTLQLDREKITIVNELFFFTKQTENLLVKDVVSLSTSENILFANITLVSGLRLNRKLSISFFQKEDARRFRRICNGLTIALKEAIDVMAISDEELVVKLEEIGSSHI
jgi:hypothetical protein